MVRGEGSGYAVYGGAPRGVAQVVGEGGLSSVRSAGLERADPVQLVGAFGLPSQLVVGQPPAAGWWPRRERGFMWAR